LQEGDGGGRGWDCSRNAADFDGLRTIEDQWLATKAATEVREERKHHRHHGVGVSVPDSITPRGRVSATAAQN
jgi:hypothetical protein